MTCLLRLLDLCRALLEHLEVQEKQLTAAEAACLLPCIVEKSGHNAVSSPQSHGQPGAHCQCTLRLTPT